MLGIRRAMTAVGEIAMQQAIADTGETRPESRNGALHAGLPAPTRRLVRAAATERRALLDRRERLAAKRAKLEDELHSVQHAVEAIDERLELLDRLTAPADTADGIAQEPPAVHGSEPDNALRGYAIRETAIRVLLGQPQEIEALHYRGWYELVRQAGYSIAARRRSARSATARPGA
jgi:hypothetical protein